MKFNHLNVPTHWQNYWTRYPEGHTILEALISWVSQVDSMVDNQNSLNDNVAQFRNEIDDFVGRFDERLQTEVTQTLEDWQASGFLDVVISSALQWQLDDYITTNEQDKLTINTQLNYTNYEATRKKKLEDLDPEVLTAIAGGEGTSFDLLTIPQNGSVTHEKMAFPAVEGEKSVNLFNKKTARLDKNMTSTGLVDNAGTYVSEFIGVTSNSDMIFNKFTDATSVYFYNNTGSEKDYLSFINITNTEGKFTVPAGATRLLFRSRLSNINTAQLQYGNTATNYEPYGGLLDADYIRERSIPLEKVDAIGKITPEYLPFIETTQVKGAEKNIKESYTFIENEVVNISTGLFEPNENYLTVKNVPLTGYNHIFIYRDASGAESATYFPLVLYKSDGSVHTGYSQMIRAGLSYDNKQGWLIPIPTGVTSASISSSTANHTDYTYLLIKPEDGILIKNLLNTIGQKTSKHYGKKAGFLGDSIVEDEPYFFNRLKNELGLSQLIDYGVGGTSIATRNSPDWDPLTATKRAKLMAKDLDVIFILIGTNDFATASVLGTMTDTTEATFYGGLHELLAYLCETYPLADIYLFTMPPRRVQLEPNTQGEYISEYVEAYYKKGRLFSVPVIDIFSNIQTKPWLPESNAYYYRGADGLHPNDRMYDLILDYALPVINQT